jgi:hypothetical protein
MRAALTMAGSVQFRLPERCPSCASMGSVRLEHTIKAQTVLLVWCCSICGRSWPVQTDDEQAERREAAGDRRRVPRKDRRQQ